jgi:hypothetical protein
VRDWLRLGIDALRPRVLFQAVVQTAFISVASIIGPALLAGFVRLPIGSYFAIGIGMFVLLAATVGAVRTRRAAVTAGGVPYATKKVETTYFDGGEMTTVETTRRARHARVKSPKPGRGQAEVPLPTIETSEKPTSE